LNPIRLDRFADIVGGKLVADGSATLEGFALDSRSVNKGDLFLAIKGENVDGHDYAPQALKAGAVAILAERDVPGPHILVPNIVEALAAFGKHGRNRFNGPVVGVTGSVGKTITKEFAASALRALGPVLKNPGNRNSEYTAPLIWADLMPEHKSVVTEMAMRGFGQIAHLCDIARPTVGVITNIGYSHIEMVGSREGIADAKSELIDALPEGAPAILWQGDLYLDILKRKCRGPVRTFGFTDDADCRVESIKLIDWYSCEIGGTVEGKKFNTVLPSIGQHIALDAAAGLLSAVVAGADVEKAAALLTSADLPPLRMQVIEFQKGTIVMDAYNSSPQSLLSALDTLTAMPCKGKRLAVIGEMKELGEYSEEAHREVGWALTKAGLDKVMFYGLPTLFTMEECLSAGAYPEDLTFAETLQDVADFLKQIGEGDVALVKGSRGLELEKALTILGVSE
jgi:UDP-N-acetylmuramoyl-tripeptide--D-alanyl-D-alanine ligase